MTTTARRALPLLVLVHGGSACSTAWDPLLAELAVPALAVDLPGRRYRPGDLGTLGRDDWVRSLTADVLASGAEQVVLVGHSSGGIVIPGAAAALPDGTVKALVMVAGNCPGEGQAPIDVMTPKLRALTEANYERLVAGASGKTLAGWRVGESPVVTDLEVVDIAATMGLEAPRYIKEPMTWVGVPSVPVLYVRGLRDRVIPPDNALLMATNAGATEVIDLDAGHDIAAEAPTELARLLEALVERVAEH
jgi:pimeloyl-ACP methyl ester carboxylesterase